MKVAWLTALALSASLALSAEPSVVLYLDANPPEAVTHQEMRAEFAALTEPLGLRTEWRTLAGRNNAVEDGSLIVVRLQGQCASTSDAADVATGQPVASVQEIDGRILPFIDIHCDKLVSLIRTAWAGRTIYEKRALLGRGLARILAHEVYHVIGQTHDHTASGITKARLSGAELTAQTAQVDSTFSSDAASSDGR